MLYHYPRVPLLCSNTPTKSKDPSQRPKHPTQKPNRRSDPPRRRIASRKDPTLSMSSGMGNGMGTVRSCSLGPSTYHNSPGYTYATGRAASSRTPSRESKPHRRHAGKCTSRRGRFFKGFRKRVRPKSRDDESYMSLGHGLTLPKRTFAKLSRRTRTAEEILPHDWARQSSARSPQVAPRKRFLPTRMRTLFRHGKRNN